MRGLPVYVNTWHGRDDIAPDTVRSLERAGCDVRVRRHGPETNPLVFLASILEEIIANGRQGECMAMRVEDDTLFREDFLAELARWPALEDERFGMGCLFGIEAVRGQRFTGRPPGGPTGQAQLFHTPALERAWSHLKPQILEVGRVRDTGIDALDVSVIIPDRIIAEGYAVHVHPELLCTLNPRAVGGWGSNKGRTNAEVSPELCFGPLEPRSEARS